MANLLFFCEIDARFADFVTISLKIPSFALRARSLNFRVVEADIFEQILKVTAGAKRALQQVIKIDSRLRPLRPQKFKERVIKMSVCQNPGFR
ncbi:MAG: hypothetical protein KIG59_09135, partial [Muribaculaceae bacterium]|nr:hypothetical protein [Muribaculaceae bacterium]